MISARKSTTTSSEGGPGGSAFDDHLSLPNLKTATVTRIVISYDNHHLRSIAVHYADAVGVARGTVSGNQVELELQKGEYVTAVEGACGDGVISRIAFVTRTKWGPYGLVAKATFVWGGFGPGMGLLYFTGNADSHIRSLSATFATYHIRAARPTAVKYEKHIDTGPDTELPPAPMSYFATNLMSPAVKLLIGPDPAVVFHTSQDILCRLPFFRAALQGQFREASSREISMPEDEPQTVAALIEFLYTGRYAYPFRTAPEDVVDGVVMGDFPTTDLAEGAYHVSVYATAHKYGCTKLEDEARKAFVFVLGELKGVEVLRLWKCAYAKELLLKAVQDDEETRGFKNGLAELLRELFKEYATEMEKTAVEYPSLVLDLLNLVVSCE